MRNMLCTAAVVVAMMVTGWSAPANAQTLITVTGKIDLVGPINPGFTVTVDATGKVTVEVPGPNPAPGQIPPGAIPPGAVPAPAPVDVGLCADEADCKKKVAAAIAGYLIRQWIKAGIAKLKEFLESIRNAINELREKFKRLFGLLPAAHDRSPAALLPVAAIEGAMAIPRGGPATPMAGPVVVEPVDPVLPVDWAQDVADLTLIALDDWAATQP